MCDYAYNSPSTLVTATGTAVSRKTRLVRTFLTGGSTDSTAVIRDGGASGTIKMTLKAKAGETSPVVMVSEDFATDIHVTLTGTAAELYVQYQ